MKKYFSLGFSLVGLVLFAQNVGINTTAPQTTLQVNSLNPTGSNTKVDGILIPRVDRERILAMGTIIPDGNLVFVNSIATGSSTGTAEFVKETGFYYYNASTSKWIKLNTGNASNIYSENGTLTGARTVNQNGNSLTFLNTSGMTTFSGGTVMFLAGIINNYKELTTSNQSLGITDYTLYKSTITTNLDFNLPGGVQNGRMICLSNIAKSGNIIVGNVGPANALNPNKNILTPGSGKCFHYIGRSEEWLPLSTYNPPIETVGSGTVSSGSTTILVTGNLSIPAASSDNIGKQYILVNDTNSTVTVTIPNYRENGTTTASVNYGLNNSAGGKGLTIQSTGSDWVIIDRF